MLLKRSALEASIPATTNNDTRYALHAIQVDPKARTYVSTNGHVLTRVRDGCPTPDAEFPLVPGAPFEGDPEAPILLGADVAGQVEFREQMNRCPACGAWVDGDVCDSTCEAEMIARTREARGEDEDSEPDEDDDTPF